MAMIDKFVGSASRDVLEKRARWFTKEGGLTPELQGRILDKAGKIKNPDSLQAVAKFAQSHDAGALAADLRYRDALVRNDFERQRFGKDFPVYSQADNKPFIQNVIDGKTVGDQADMLAQLADAGRLDANSGTAKVAHALQDIQKVLPVDMYRPATSAGLLRDAMELQGGDVPLQTARVMSASLSKPVAPQQLIDAVKYLRQMPDLPTNAAKHLDLGIQQADRAMQQRTAEIEALDKKYTRTTQPGFFAKLRGEQPTTYVDRNDYNYRAYELPAIENKANSTVNTVLAGALKNVADLPLAHAPRTIDQPKAIATQLRNLLDEKTAAGDWTLYKNKTLVDWHEQFVNRANGSVEGSAVTDHQRSLFESLTSTDSAQAMSLATSGERSGQMGADVKVAFDKFGHMAPPATVGDVLAQPDNYIVRRNLPGKPGEYEFVPLNSGDHKAFFRLAEKDIKDAAPKR